MYVNYSINLYFNAFYLNVITTHTKATLVLCSFVLCYAQQQHSLFCFLSISNEYILVQAVTHQRGITLTLMFVVVL